MGSFPFERSRLASSFIVDYNGTVLFPWLI
jgi:hypothetical protein